MGSSRWTPDNWSAYSKAAEVKTREELFSSSLPSKFDPKNIALRESRDSDANPNSTALILALDVTGSMGSIAEALAKEHLGTLVEGIYKRKPISDPHIAIMGVGDVDYDKAPLQVSQFEADIKIAQELKDLWLEGNGGGNSSESYNLPWYFAAMKTSIDCWEKRKKKGYLFTIGDELPPNSLTSLQLEKVFGVGKFNTLSNDELITLVSRRYEIFHIIIEEGNFARGRKEEVKKEWAKLLGQHVISLSDYRAISEAIVSILQVANGENKEEVTKSWDGEKNLIVRDAIRELATHKTSNKVVRI